MSPFDLDRSLQRARQRLGPATHRRRRSDRGTSRLDPRVLDCVAGALAEQERPPPRDTFRRIGTCCRSRGLEPPSRASIYKLMLTLPGPTYRAGDLPESVQSALYNLDQDSEVPGRQVAFYCFNYGDLAAVSFASGLPWLVLYQARRLRGFRERSRGLIEAAMRARGI